MNNRHFDALIIGGGVIGLSCAYFLARTGKRVQVLDRARVGMGTSYGNCGLITPSHAEPTCKPGRIGSVARKMASTSASFRVVPGLDRERWKWLAAFARNCTQTRSTEIMQAKISLLNSSRTLTEKLIRLESLNCDWHDCGLLSVCNSDKGYAELTQLARQLEALDIPCTLLDRQATHALEPTLNDEVIGGLFFPSDAWLNPSKYTAELARACQDKQVSIEEMCEIEAIHHSDHRIDSVYTRLGDFTADQYIIATGVETPELLKPLEIPCPIQPGKGYSITSRKPDLCPKHALILHEASMAVTPWSDQFRLGGTMEIAGFDQSMNKKRLELLIQGSIDYLKDHIGTGVPEKWYGFRPMTPDDLPMIGQPGQWSNLMLATGHNMLGMSMAAGTGRLVAELTSGRKPHIDPTPFDPNRFD